MLVRVAGLTVELLASNQAARPAAEATQAQPAAPQQTYQPEPEPTVAAPVETEEQSQAAEPEFEFSGRA